MEEQNVILKENEKQAQELQEQRRLLEDKETQLAEAQQTILQMSTEKAQKTILSNKAERLNTDSPLMTSISSGFRYNDCFERLYATADCTYETPKIIQFEIQSTKTIVTSVERSLSLSAREHEQLHTEVTTDILQTNIDSNSEDENCSKEPTNIRLLSYFNQSIDETYTIQSDDDEDGEITIKQKTRRVTRHQENEEQQSISDDLKLHNILYKRDVYEPKIRVVSPKNRSIVRQNN